MNQFNNDFLIGAATAAHQVEGNNKNSDNWAMENMPGSTFNEPSLDAMNHYNQFKEDIQLLADSGCNAYRFSIEWARIEPEKGWFNQQEIEHYREVLEYCYEKKITPMVTLHHFSSPFWLIKEGGWESETTIEYFGRYAKHVAEELGSLIPYICTINEANMGKQIQKIMESMKDLKGDSARDGDIQVGLNMKEQMEKYYRSVGDTFGMDPREVHPFLGPRSDHGERIVMKCHEKARSFIKDINEDIKVGITFSLYDHQALPGGEEYVRKEQVEDFLDYLPYINEDDFLGVQNYSRKIHGPSGVVKPDENTRVTKMGYEFYPEALGNVLKFVAKHWSKPMIVTENGISTDNDEERVEYIKKALSGVHRCVEKGIPVIGYTHWSLLDNFEWQLGYAQTFGLIAVDRTTQTRFPKPSLSYLGNIKKSGLEIQSKKM